MRLLRRLDLVLVPVMTVVAALAGTGLYFWQLSEQKTLEQDKWVTKVKNALSAAEFERSGIEGLGHEISGSAQFINHIQDTSDYVLRGFLESHINYLLHQERAMKLGNVEVYSLDPLFNLTASSLKSDPFEANALADDIYQTVFDSYILVSLGEEFCSTGYTYQSVTGEIRYSYIGAYDPKLLPDDKQAMTRKSRSLLVVDGPLRKLNQLFNDASNHENIILDFNQVTETSELWSDIHFEVVNNEFVDGKVIKIFGPGVEIELDILDDHYANVKSQIATQVLVYMLAVVISLLLIIHVIVRTKVLDPINGLLKDIKRGGLELRYFKRAKDNDEVSILKNAYIDSLSKVKFEAEFDSLTKLANRASFIRFVDQRTESYCNEHTYIVAWDVIDFRRVNDLHGLFEGDRALVKIAREIERCICTNQSSTGCGCSDYSISRYGSNTFYALVNADSEQAIKLLMANFEQSLKTAIRVEGVPLHLDFAQAIFPLCDESQRGVWQKGIEAALSKAKQIKNKVPLVYFDHLLFDELKRRDEIEKILLSCCGNGEFELNYMPLIDSTTYQVASIEVLVRCPKLRAMGIGPEEFIPAAERANLIGDIDTWVINNAIKSLSMLQSKVGYVGDISINISALELYNNDFIELICSVCHSHNITPNRVILEVTETSYVKSTKDTIAIIAGLRDIGFRVSLDDFGTGFTSINQLLSYPVDELKVDKSFVERIGTDGTEERMLNSIIALGHNCNAKVVGEGVETGYQCRYLSDLGCDYLQGYWFSKPLGFEAFCDFYVQDRLTDLKAKMADITIIKH
ncbi:bifunctional diguanylate cyclase/phosphodiesterase [Vibrio maritimus]|uniref:bifunctional diguanylate cyclase/phosphodiesterase n=1 Tax=Vibrio maritimus TaxID=990268 RepID=UPI001F1C89A2|nr:bifunctional diguanylate cyclase/phosphodiesterase [Vibrio maritimus]